MGWGRALLLPVPPALEGGGWVRALHMCQRFLPSSFGIMTNEVIFAICVLIKIFVSSSITLENGLNLKIIEKAPK